MFVVVNISFILIESTRRWYSEGDELDSELGQPDGEAEGNPLGEPLGGLDGFQEGNKLR